MKNEKNTHAAPTPKECSRGHNIIVIIIFIEYYDQLVRDAACMCNVLVAGHLSPCSENQTKLSALSFRSVAAISFSSQRITRVLYYIYIWVPIYTAIRRPRAQPETTTEPTPPTTTPSVPSGVRVCRYNII